MLTFMIRKINACLMTENLHTCEISYWNKQADCCHAPIVSLTIFPFAVLTTQYHLPYPKLNTYLPHLKVFEHLSILKELYPP